MSIAMDRGASMPRRTLVFPMESSRTSTSLPIRINSPARLRTTSTGFPQCFASYNPLTQNHNVHPPVAGAPLGGFVRRDRFIVGISGDPEPCGRDVEVRFEQ